MAISDSSSKCTTHARPAAPPPNCPFTCCVLCGHPTLHLLCVLQTAGCGKPVLLVHGFGASCGHYRKTIPYLAKHGFKVGAPALCLL